MPPRKQTAPAARKRKFDWNDGFQVRRVKSGKPQQPKKKNKVNGTQAANSTSSTPEIATQRNPYGGHSQLSDVHYQVDPSDVWDETDRYRKFTIENAGFETGQIVFIKADSSQDTAPTSVQGWVAKILEVRASDPSHVFLRIFWMYRPEDLPGGRKPYHGAAELIASNDMAIIDALTVESEATVIHWQEKADQEETLKQDQLFWRQTYDVVTGGTLSKLPTHCVEKTPCNPDGILVQCEACLSWLHGSCLEKEALREAYKSHNVPEPGEVPSKNTGGVSKKGAKKGKPVPAFTALIKATASGKTRLTITDQRDEKKQQKYNVAVKCLLCHETIEEAVDEEPPKPAMAPTPLFDKDEQDVDETQDNITLDKGKAEDVDSVIGKTEGTNTQESTTKPANEIATPPRTGTPVPKNSAKGKSPWLSKLVHQE